MDKEDRMALEECRENYKIQSQTFTINNFGFWIEHAEWLSKSISDKVKSVTIDYRRYGFDYETLFPYLYNIVAECRSLEIKLEADSEAGDIYTLRINKRYGSPAPAIEEHFYATVFEDDGTGNPRVMELQRFVTAELEKAGCQCSPVFAPEATVYREHYGAPMYITELTADHVSMGNKETAIEFTKAINKFPHLVALRTEYCDVPSEALAGLISVLDSNLQLRSLTLESADPDALQHLHKYLLKNTNLRSLSIRMPTTPPILKDSDTYFFDVLTQCPSLKSLNLLVGKIHDLKRLAALLKDHPSITSLHIDYAYNNDTDYEDIIAMIPNNKRLQSVLARVINWNENFIKFLEESTHLAEVKFIWVHRKTLANDQTILEAFDKYPYLTKIDPPMPILDARLAENIANRNRFQEDMIVLLYNIARNQSDFSQLPKELSSTVMKHVVYPGVNQDFGQILLDFFANGAIRRVVKDLS